MENVIHEECGVFGIWEPEESDTARMVYYGLIALQHRGQEAAGIAVNRNRDIFYHKDVGLVQDVFTNARLEKLGKGQMAIGHVRYATSGGDIRENAQPMVVRHIKGQIALCHNGNLVNSSELRKELELKGCIFHTSSDTEVISYLVTQARLTEPSIEEAVNQTMNRIEGAYSLVIMSPSKLIACRDPYGFRPLCMGRTETGGYVFASESCALDAVGARLIRDIEPGEIVIVDHDGTVRTIRDHVGTKEHHFCVFEYIYFSRPDSIVEGVPVHDCRMRAGEFLAEEHPVDADIVIGVPDSGLDAALGFSRASGIPYGIGLIKNKYIGRTFIAPGQKEREKLVHLKLNPIADAIKGKRVVLIDDSIVRGTTSAQIVRLIREAGAREVHMRISAPPFMNPCFYGTDIDSREHLIACHHSIPEISRIIGADSLGFLSIDHARRLALDRNPKGFCAACFDGIYPTVTPEEGGHSRSEETSGSDF